MSDAKARRKKIDLAIGVATFNGWSVGVFAGLSGLVLLFSFGVLGLILTVGLAAVAYQEFRGRAGLRQLDPGGARLLGWNQVALGALIVGYCAWNLATTLLGAGAYDDVIQRHPELAQVLGDTGALIRFVAAAVYGVAIALTIPYQALVAWFYFSRTGHIERYVQQTPAWVTQVQRAAA
jgi:hypothetical protein